MINVPVGRVRRSLVQVVGCVTDTDLRARRPAPNGANFERRTVNSMAKAMVIDDSRAIRMILGRTLSQLGWEVISAGNGREALELVQGRDNDVGLVLVDWNMPEMNGLEFVKAFRADPKFTQVPLMMVTTETEIDQMVRALEAGANEYVMKPFTEEVIADKLRILGVLE
jgi:two-component system, chemotaxis family, chemotaxis protein CheY